MPGAQVRVSRALKPLLCLALSTSAGVAQTYFPVEITRNAQLPAGLPTGSLTFGGVPFTIPTGGLNYWDSEGVGGPNPRILDIGTNRYGVSRVFTLINTMWGKTGGPFASLEFFGDNGGYYKKDLYGDIDIRDYNKSNWTNSINGTTTVNVFENATMRLDRQQIDLPAAFANQTLVRIRLSDSGAADFQRTILCGVTVESQYALAGVMAQLASGGTWKTSITLMNTGSGAGTATLQAYDDAGRALRLPWTFSAGAPETESSITRTLQPGAGLLMETVLPDNQAPAVGWLRVHGSSGMTGFAVFRQKVGESEQEAVVPLETREAQSYLLWFDNTSGYSTGIAVANNYSLQAVVVLTIRDDTGRILLTENIFLAPNGHTSFSLTERFLFTRNIRGTVELRRPAGGQIGVLGLRFNPRGAFTTIPPAAR